MARVPIHMVHIADGFTDDCEELIHKCLQVDIFNYQIFCEIWKDMNFATAFYRGRSSSAETAELSEELIVIAKHYMVAHPSNFEESVIGLFLVYALVNLQPFSGFAKLRLVPEDIDAVLTIQSEARRLRRLDVLYILGSLLVKHSEYVADLRPRSMETGFKKYLLEPATMSDQGVRPKGVFYRQNEELDVIRQLNFLGQRYMQAKAFVKKNGEDRNLKYVDENMASNLEKSIKNIINGVLELPSDNTDSSSQHNSMVHTIKAKAMKGTVNIIRHLTSVAQIEETLPPDKNKPKGKTNKKSDKNMSPSTSASKKSKLGKGMGQLFRKRKHSTSSSESDELSQSSHTGDTNDDDDQSNDESPAKVAKDLPVINFNGEATDTEKNHSKEGIKTDNEKKLITREGVSLIKSDLNSDVENVEEFEVQSDGEMRKVEKVHNKNPPKLCKIAAKRTRRKLTNQKK